MPLGRINSRRTFSSFSMHIEIYSDVNLRSFSEGGKIFGDLEWHRKADGFKRLSRVNERP
jgi:hypothetical protein